MPGHVSRGDPERPLLVDEELVEVSACFRREDRLRRDLEPRYVGRVIREEGQLHPGEEVRLVTSRAFRSDRLDEVGRVETRFLLALRTPAGGDPTHTRAARAPAARSIGAASSRGIGGTRGGRAGAPARRRDEGPVRPRVRKARRRKAASARYSTSVAPHGAYWNEQAYKREVGTAPRTSALSRGRTCRKRAATRTIVAAAYGPSRKAFAMPPKSGRTSGGLSGWTPRTPAPATPAAKRSREPAMAAPSPSPARIALPRRGDRRPAGEGPATRPEAGDRVAEHRLGHDPEADESDGHPEPARDDEPRHGAALAPDSKREPETIMAAIEEPQADRDPKTEAAPKRRTPKRMTTRSPTRPKRGIAMASPRNLAARSGRRRRGPRSRAPRSASPAWGRGA